MKSFVLHWAFAFWLLAGVTPAAAQTVNAAISWTVTQDWGGGANVTLRITNTGPATITNNLFEFDFGRTIAPYNNMLIASRVGNHYAMTNQTYIPKAIAPGASIYFDMQVTPGNLLGDQPTNYLINGLPLAGAQPALRIGNASILEGDAGSAGLDFLVSLAPPATNIVWVRYATAGGSATSGVDFVPASGLLTFTAGATQQFVTVTIIGDTLEEGDETFTVTLSNATNASIAAATGTGTILNNDAPPTVITLFPLAGAVVRALAQVEVTFSEPVTGVDAADLFANGVAATNVIAAAGNRFVFQFASLVPDTDRHSWSAGIGRRGKRWEWDVAYQFTYGAPNTVRGSAPNLAGQSADGRYSCVSHALTGSVGWRF